jgi:hypothetical protein
MVRETCGLGSNNIPSLATIQISKAHIDQKVVQAH